MPIPLPLEGRPEPRGFTLLEILIAITVMALLTAIVGPRVVAYAQQSQVETAAQQLLGDLERARTAAIKRNTTVTFARSGPGSYSIEYVGSRSFDSVTFSSAPDSVVFASFGPPLGGGTFVLQRGDYTKTVLLNAAGHAEIQ